MAEAKTPEEVLDQIYEGHEESLPVEQKTITRSSAKVDEGVKTIEDRVIRWQEVVNHWRITITQNEQIIIVFCVLFGLCYSYAINECTGNLNFPVYAYVLVGVIIFTLSLLLIAGGELPLIVLVKFACAAAFGHVAMMFLIAADGHTWNIIAVRVCRYPLTTDSIMVFLVGGGFGYIYAKFEEIRVARRK